MSTLPNNVIETCQTDELADSDVFDLAKERDGQLVVDKLTHQEIANIVGASREMVTLIMHNLVECGYVTLGNNRQIIQNEQARSPF
jgi:CRP/FNR family cyclic AMP-dependent transcriptional regulator